MIRFIKKWKTKYDINRKAAKILALSSGKIDKYKYLTGKEILPSDLSIMIEQANFNHSSLGKALEKQTKAIYDQRRKQIDALRVLKPDTQQLTFRDAILEDQLNGETKNEIERTKEILKMKSR